MPIIKTSVPTNLQKIKELLSDSNLSPQDNADLVALFAKANDEELDSAIKLFTENPDWIYKINENYKSKQSAFAADSPALWQDILQKEQIQLDELGS
jgi:hypothetical protein